MQPRSRGALEWFSSDALTPPKIDPNFLAEPADREILQEALEFCRELGARSAFGRWGPRELTPGALSESEKIGFIRQAATTYFHPVGSCRMGADPQTAVVDPQLRVYGAENLRVADASIAPSIPNANTNAAAVMIGEFLSQLLAPK